ncbi:MAG: hypothetical protein ACM3ST_14755 [Bdellovibrio bacteriovorus]
MSNDATPTDDEKCVRTVVGALMTDPELVGFLRELAPQWGSSVGKTRSFRSARLMTDPDARCTLRVDSRAAIMLNDAIYNIDGPAPSVSFMRDALLNAQIDEGGRRCVIHAPELGTLQVRVEQYVDALGAEVAPDSQSLDHRVVSIAKIG